MFSLALKSATREPTAWWMPRMAYRNRKHHHHNKSLDLPLVSILRVRPADPTDQRTFAFVPIMPALKGQEELRTTGWTPAIPGQGELLTPGIDQTPNENQVAGWSVAGRFGDWKQIKITPEMQEYVIRFTPLPLGIAGLNAASSTEQFVLPWALGTRGTSC